MPAAGPLRSSIWSEVFDRPLENSPGRGGLPGLARVGLLSLGPLSMLSPRFLVGIAVGKELYAKPIVGEVTPRFGTLWVPAPVFVTLGLREPLADGG